MLRYDFGKAMTGLARVRGVLTSIRIAVYLYSYQSHECVVVGRYSKDTELDQQLSLKVKVPTLIPYASVHVDFLTLENWSDEWSRYPGAPLMGQLPMYPFRYSSSTPP